MVRIKLFTVFFFRLFFLFSDLSFSDFTLAESSHYGNVLLGGRPVCGTHWDSKEAFVVCRQLGFGQKTKAIATTNSHFGRVYNNFIVDKVVCKGSERNLR